jgi:hypothetical protein
MEMPYLRLKRVQRLEKDTSPVIAAISEIGLHDSLKCELLLIGTTGLCSDAVPCVLW